MVKPYVSRVQNLVAIFHPGWFMDLRIGTLSSGSLSSTVHSLSNQGFEHCSC